MTPIPSDSIPRLRTARPLGKVERDATVMILHRAEYVNQYRTKHRFQISKEFDDPRRWMQDHLTVQNFQFTKHPTVAHLVQKNYLDDIGQWVSRHRAV